MRAHAQVSEELVQYALGELDAGQAAEVREHLDSCAACRRELSDVQAELATLALSVTSSAPPARAKDNLMKAVSAEPKMRRVYVRRPWWSFAPGMAAVLLAVVGLLLYYENSQLRGELKDARSKIEQQQQQSEQASEIVSALTSPETVKFTLVSSNAKPQPQARAMYLGRRGAVLLIASHLQPVPNKKAYELWLLPDNGSKPMPAGTFKPDQNGNATVMTPNVKCDCKPKTFAVTIEPEEGSQTPTMPIVMSGE